MKQTGQILKASREEQRITLNEVSMATKINLRLLTSIESGDTNSLPAKTFLRGFVQSYAAFLKLDVDKILQVFHEEMGTTLPVDDDEMPSQKIEEKSEPAKPLQLLQDRGIIPKIAAGAGILLLIFIIIGVKNIVEKYEKEGEVAPPPDNIQQLDNAEPVTPDLNPKKSSSSQEVEKPEVEAEVKKIKANTSKPIPDKKTEMPTPPVAIEPPTKPIVAVKPEVKKEKEKKPTEPAPEVSSQPAPSQPPKPTPLLKSKNEIIIEALDTVEIEFRVNDGELKRVNLQPNQIHTIKALGPVNIDFSDGGAVNLIHNGRDNGVPGDLGKPKKIRIK